jgi:hypothetical protein
VRAGQETEGLQSYHPTLASALEKAAYRIADGAEPFTLKWYAKELRTAIAELRQAATAGV